MSNPIFQNAGAVAPPIFSEAPIKGSGSETTDDFISSRIALMSNDSDQLRQLALAQAGVKRMDPEELQSFVAGVTDSASADLKSSAIEHYAGKGDIDTGVKHVEELNNVDTLSEVERLAILAPKYLDQFEQYSIPREIARRNLLSLMVATKMEERGMKLDTGWQKTKSFLGTQIPGRATWQFAVSPIDLGDSVKKFQTLKDDVAFHEFAGVLDQLADMSGNNPFYYLERAQSYLNPDDVKTLYAYLGLDVVDAATTLLVAPKVLKLMKLARATNTPIKFLRDTGQMERAAALVDQAAGDNVAAKTAGTTQADAASSMSPFGGEGIDPGITDQLSAETQAIVAARQAAVADAVAPLNDQNLWIRRHQWTPEEIAGRNARLLDQFAGSARIVSQQDDGVTLEVTIQRPASKLPTSQALETRITELRNQISMAGDILSQQEEVLGKAYATDSYVKSVKAQKVDAFLELSKKERLLERVLSDEKLPPSTIKTEHIKYTNDDYGGMDAVQYDRANQYITSPSTHVEQMLPGKVDTATFVDNDSARMIGIFLKARNKIFEGVGKTGRKRIDSLLLKGDVDQVVYTNRDLVDGVMTPDGLIKLKSAEELAAYRASRDMFDVLHVLKNRELRRTLELDGYKALKFKLPDGTNALNFANPERGYIGKADVKRLYDIRKSMIVEYSSLGADESRRFYKLKHPVEIDGETIEYALAKDAQFRDLPQEVLNKRVGYVTKIDKNVFYVAERIGDKLVNGNTLKNQRTVVRYFDNPQEAREWSTGQTAKGQRVEIRTGKEWLDAQPGRAQEYEAQVFGGLRTGERSDSVIPFGLQGTPAERVGGVEAMEAYMNHLSTRLPATEFRSSLINRFLNSSKDPLTGESYLREPNNWRSEIVANDNKIKSGLEAAQRWIEDQVRIPTTEERMWQNVAVKMADYFGSVPGPVGKKLGKALMNFTAKDLFTRMRGLAFHSTLGWFNISQFMVQAMGSSIAISLDPVRAPLFIARSLALRSAMFSTDEAVMKIAAKAAFLDEDAFATMVKAYQKTGLHEATLTSADYAALDGLPNGMDVFRKTASLGLIPFKEGERWARNYAWVKAYDDITKGSKLKQIPDKMVDAITALHLRYTLNLNRSNRAFWQKGVLSIPTMFYQISAKFIENMAPNILIKTPKGWTGIEKAQILLGQVALFGAAGLPGGRAILDHFSEWIKSDQDYGLAVTDPIKRQALYGGLSDLMLYNWTGAELDVTNRLSINAGIEQTMEMIRDDRSSVSDTVMGVFGTISDRSWQAALANLRIFRSVIKDPGSADASTIYEVLDNVAKVTSTWNNYRKAQIWEETGRITDRYGRLVTDQIDAQMILAQKWGIAPKILADYRALKKFNKNKESDYQDAATAVITISQRHYQDPEILTNEKLQKRMEAEIEVAMYGFTEEERTKIMEKVYKTQSDNKFALPEEMEKALDNIYNMHGASEVQGIGTMVDQGSEASAQGNTSAN